MGDKCAGFYIAQNVNKKEVSTTENENEGITSDV